MRTRVITAVALLLLVAAVLFAGSETVWVIFLAVLLVLAADEWTTLSGFRCLWWRASTAMFTFGVASSRYLGEMTAGRPFDLVIFVALWFVGAGWMLGRPLQEIRGMALAERCLSLFWGVICLLALAEALLQLYRIDIVVLVASMAVVWVSDSVAYFAGRRFGKRKLAPLISPGKSWEGVWAALLAVAVMGLIWVIIAPAHLPDMVTASPLPSLAMAALCVLTGVAGISGDLVESRLKRVAGVKDSGRCLPGHGGVLDRIDALIPAMPVMAVAYVWVVP